MLWAVGARCIADGAPTRLAVGKEVGMRDDMLVTRRALLRGTVLVGTSALMVCGAASQKALADGAVVEGGENGKTQYGFLVDMSKCVDCRKCVEACRRENDLSADTPDRRKITKYVNKKKETVTISTSCMHCGTPSCMVVCPAGAITKDGKGIVSVDKSVCIGCKYCYQACPYEVPHYNSEAMDKCDCCLNAKEPIPAGGTPYCVRACKFDALRYGPIEELKAQAGEGVRPIAAVNDPSCLLV